MQEIHPTLIKFLELLEDQLEDELSFEDSVYGIKEEQFRKDLRTIEDFICNYYDDIDMFEYFGISSNIEEINIDTSIIDYASYCESEEKLIKARKKLKEINFDLELFSQCEALYLKILKENIDIAEHPDYFKNSTTYDSFTNSIKKLIFDKNIQHINEQFKSSNYHLNPLYKKLYKLLKSDVEQEFSLITNNFHYEKRFKSLLYLHKEYTPVIEPYLKYYNLFKHLSKLPEEDTNRFDLNKMHSAEEIYDFLIKSVGHSELKKYMRSFLGSYMELANEETFQIFKFFKNYNYQKEYIKESLKNIAMFEEPSILNLTLQQIIENKKNHSTSIILDEIKSKSLNSDTLLNKNNILALRINDFHTSSVLAKNSWCISKNQSFYDSYLKDNDSYHVFIYNFNKKQTDGSYKIGITFSENGIYKAFDNNNTSISTSKIYELFSKETIEQIQKNNKFILEIKKSSNSLNIDLHDIQDPLYLFTQIDFKNINLEQINIDLKTMKLNSSILDRSESLNTYLKLCNHNKINPFENIYFKTEYYQLKYSDRIELDSEFSLETLKNSNNRILKNKII